MKSQIKGSETTKRTGPPITKEQAMLAYFKKHSPAEQLVSWVTKVNSVIYTWKSKEEVPLDKLDASYFMYSFGDLINSYYKGNEVNEKLSNVFNTMGGDDIKSSLREIGSAFLRDYENLGYLPGDAGKFLHQLACIADLSEMNEEYELYLEYTA